MSYIIFILFLFSIYYYIKVFVPYLGRGADFVYSQLTFTKKLLLLAALPVLSFFLFPIFYLIGRNDQRRISFRNVNNSYYRKTINFIRDFCTYSFWFPFWFNVSIILSIRYYIIRIFYFINNDLYCYFICEISVFKTTLINTASVISNYYTLYEKYINIFYYIEYINKSIIDYLTNQGVNIESIEGLLSISFVLLSLIMAVIGNDYIRQKIYINYPRNRYYSFMFWSLWFYAFSTMLLATIIIGLLLKIRSAMCIQKSVNTNYSKIIFSSLTTEKILKLLIRYTEVGAIKEAKYDVKVLIDSVNQQITSSNAPIYKSAVYYQIQSIIDARASLNYINQTVILGCFSGLQKTKIGRDIDVGFYGVVIGIIASVFSMGITDDNLVNSIVHFEDYILYSKYNFIFYLLYLFAGIYIGYKVGVCLGKKVYAVINAYYNAFYNEINNERKRVIDSDRALIVNYSWENDTYEKEVITPILTYIGGKNTPTLITAKGNTLLQNTHVLLNSYENSKVQNSAQ